MNSLIRILFSIGVAAVALGTGAGESLAQPYPEKPIRIIVPFSPGGGSDIVARAIAPTLSSALGQPVMVDNRPGADGGIGALMVAKSPADGHTLLVGTQGTMVISPAIKTKIPYDTRQDFSPITQLIIQPIALVVHPSLPVNTPAQFAAHIKAEIGKYAKIVKTAGIKVE